MARWRGFWMGWLNAFFWLSLAAAWAASFLGDDPLHTGKLVLQLLAAMCALHLALRLADAVRGPAHIAH
jgi:hypothetical protein